jgi:hypothetical protein
MNAQINSQLQPTPSRRSQAGLGAVQVQTIRPKADAPFVTTQPALANTAVQIVLPLKPGFVNLTLTWPPWVDSQMNLHQGHAQQQDNSRSDPTKGIFWFWIDGNPSFAKFTWSDYGTGLNAGETLLDDHTATVMIVGAQAKDQPPKPPPAPKCSSGSRAVWTGAKWECQALKPLQYGGSAQSGGGVQSHVGVVQGGLQSGVLQGGTQTATASTTSSKTPYVVGGLALAAAGGAAAWWKWGRKKRR